MHIGDVTTWPTGCTAHEQALKPLEEASEVHGAWQAMASAELAHGGDCVLARLWRKRLLDECADVIQATCNCDRCGAYFQPESWKGQYAFVINPEYGEDGRSFDLCDECMKKLVAWLKDEVEQ